jgi:hypothetical protein
MKKRSVTNVSYILLIALLVVAIVGTALYIFKATGENTTVAGSQSSNSIDNGSNSEDNSGTLNEETQTTFDLYVFVNARQYVKTYSCDGCVTWSDWVGSEYNTDGVYIDDDGNMIKPEENCDYYLNDIKTISTHLKADDAIAKQALLVAIVE